MWMLIAAAGVILAIIVILPAYLSSPSGKKLILSKISRAIDGQVDAKTLSVGWFKGIRLTDLTFSDDKGMMSVSVRTISAKPKLMAMLRGNLALGKTLLDAPKAVINIEYPVFHLSIYGYYIGTGSGYCDVVGYFHIDSESVITTITIGWYHPRKTCLKDYLVYHSGTVIICICV